MTDELGPMTLIRLTSYVLELSRRLDRHLDDPVHLQMGTGVSAKCQICGGIGRVKDELGSSNCQCVRRAPPARAVPADVRSRKESQKIVADDIIHGGQHWLSPYIAEAIKDALAIRESASPAGAAGGYKVCPMCQDRDGPPCGTCGGSGLVAAEPAPPASPPAVKWTRDVPTKPGLWRHRNGEGDDEVIREVSRASWSDCLFAQNDGGWTRVTVLGGEWSTTPLPPPGEPGKYDKVALWDAINEYTNACGGNTSSRTISPERMKAVSKVESLIGQPPPGEPGVDTKQDVAQRGRILEKAAELIGSEYLNWGTVEAALDWAAKHILYGKLTPGESGKMCETSGVALIAAERKRQIEVEGWTAEHDDADKHCELALAASAYIDAAGDCVRKWEIRNPREWPEGWGHKWWKPSADPVRNLVKAGALIAAEIDRLQRVGQPLPAGGKP